MRMDIPLPMPRSVMSSPSHMIMPVPAVMVSTMSRTVASDWSGMIVVQFGPKSCEGLRA